jgi:hypothetical protein
MSSSIDNRQLLQALSTTFTALSSAALVSTSAFFNAIQNQITNDTGLTLFQIACLNAVSSGLGSVTPSCGIANNLFRSNSGRET